MNHNILRLLIISSLFCQRSQAQDGSKLTVPSSPAFSILNYEPSAIMRPTNVKSLSTDVLNSFDKKGKLLMNLGLEVAPYWLGSHPKLKMSTYLRPNLGQTILQSFSISAATVKDSVSGDNKLGAGFRFKFHNGEPASGELAVSTLDLKESSKVLAAIETEKIAIDAGVHNKKQEAIDGIVDQLSGKIKQILIDDLKKMAEKIKADFPESKAGLNSFLEKLSANMQASYKELQTKVSDLLYQRKGFIIEIAGASGFSTSKNNSLERLGFWGNVSYYVSPDDLFSFTARYMFQNKDTSLKNFDAGLGYLKKTDKFNITVEGLMRWYKAYIPDVNLNNQPITRVEEKFTYRLAAQGSYLISRDISLNISLGKDFDSPFISGSGFFSILGLNYSIFSKEPTKLK